MQGNNNEVILSFLMNRRSVLAAKLTDPGPNTNELNDIITAGIRVPDHGRCYPWRIQVVSKDGQKKLGMLYSKILLDKHKNEKKEYIDYWYSRPQSAPCLLVVTFNPDLEKKEKIPLIEQELSGGAMCQNILNASHALGYSAQWLTEWPAYNSEVKIFLGHKKDTQILGFIFIGTANENPKERKRALLSDIVTYFD